LDRLGTKWVAMIITLLARPSSPELRFAELAKAMPGVSHRMLSQELKRLTTDGLVSRAEESRTAFHQRCSIVSPHKRSLGNRKPARPQSLLPRPAGSDHKDVHQIGWIKVQSVRLRNSQNLEAR